MNIDIANLKTEPQHLAQLARWHHAQWASLNPGLTLEARMQNMREYLEDDPVPSTFIAKSNQRLVGSAAIVVSDMDSHPEYSPWLASVFVEPESRGRGIGSKLVRYVSQYAAETDINALYLFTPDQQAFYQRLGWARLSQEIYHGTSVTVMKLTL